jgi:hypothetical protein
VFGFPLDRIDICFRIHQTFPDTTITTAITTNTTTTSSSSSTSSTSGVDELGSASAAPSTPFEEQPPTERAEARRAARPAFVLTARRMRGAGSGGDLT